MCDLSLIHDRKDRKKDTEICRLTRLTWSNLRDKEAENQNAARGKKWNQFSHTPVLWRLPLWSAFFSVSPRAFSFITDDRKTSDRWTYKPCSFLDFFFVEANECMKKTGAIYCDISAALYIKLKWFVKFRSSRRERCWPRHSHPSWSPWCRTCWWMWRSSWWPRSTIWPLRWSHFPSLSRVPATKKIIRMNCCQDINLAGLVGVLKARV